MTSVIKITDDFDLEKIRCSGQIFRMKKVAVDGGAHHAHHAHHAYTLINGSNILQIQELESSSAVSTEGTASAAKIIDAPSNKVLKASELTSREYLISCSQDEFKKIWHPFFDLGRNYVQIRKQFSGKNDFIDDCLSFGRGLRILKQDPWEMIVTFIISQRKSMPAIATCVEKLCAAFGDRISFERAQGAAVLGGSAQCGSAQYSAAQCNTAQSRSTQCSSAQSDSAQNKAAQKNTAQNHSNQNNFYTFPSAEKLAALSEDTLLKCGLGYRAAYVLDAARKVNSGELSIKECKDLPDEELFSKLCEIRGVGLKVANCIMLFGFGRTSCAPIDVWISRVIDQEFAGTNPFPTFGSYAGIIQQYMFFWKTQHKSDK